MPDVRQQRVAQALPAGRLLKLAALRRVGGHRLRGTLVADRAIGGPVCFAQIAEIVNGGGEGLDIPPNDNGRNITLEWKLSPNDVLKSKNFKGYDVYRGTGPTGPFEVVGDATGGESDEGRHVKIFGDGNNVNNKSNYYYYVAAKWDDQIAKSEVVGPIKASPQWFHTGRTVSLILLGILIAAILYYIQHAKAGKELFIRKIAGLEAVDEAVGRATEMGKKVFYIPGTQDMDNVQTIAGLTIISRVAKLTAEYETKLEVPVSRSLVMITAREIVKEAYLNAGRPDYYSDDMIYYLTDDQFGYAAGIDGLVVRQRPATIFYMGAFYAESLILAETGNSIGAIQIAGTAMPAQLPFFVAACDYTLIGEELFAASAYLSREPKLLGSLKGQDIGGKLISRNGPWDFALLTAESRLPGTDGVRHANYTVARAARQILKSSTVGLMTANRLLDGRSAWQRRAEICHRKGDHCH